jgi:glycosyltransferase involved in cell wall biosynthesis
MRIAIDATALPFRHRGAANYITHLIAHLPGVDDRNEYVVLCKTKDVAVLPSGPRVSLVPVALTTRPQRLLWEQLVLPSVLRRLRIDVLHSPHFSAPIVTGASRRVVTVHDLAAYRHPESHSFVKRWYFRSMIRAARRADRIVTLAESIRDDLIHRHGVPADRIDVVPHGVDDAFRPLGENVPAERALEEYGLTHPFVLYVGELSARKNLERLIEAVERLAGSIPMMVALVGPMGQGAGRLRARMARSPLRGRIRVMGYMSPSDLIELYRAADVFVYPSLYEGFGLPVLEAMACGTPVIISDRQAMTEVAGDAALRFEATSAEALADVLATTLLDDDLARSLRARARARARAFTWPRTAELTRDAYERAIRVPGTNGG